MINSLFVNSNTVLKLKELKLDFKLNKGDLISIDSRNYTVEGLVFESNKNTIVYMIKEL